MSQDDIYVPDEALEQYKAEQIKKKKAQESIVFWNPEMDTDVKSTDNPPIDTVDVKIKNGLFNMPKIVLDKLKVTAEKIEKPKRKYTKRANSVPKVKIVLLSPWGKVPDKAHSDDACFDIYSAEEVNISQGEVVTVKTDIAIQVPIGQVVNIFSRSGLASKFGIFVLNSPAKIDALYTGQLFVILGCLKDNQAPYKIMKGDRVAQMSIQKVDPMEFDVVKELDKTERNTGGIGSSGR